MAVLVIAEHDNASIKAATLNTVTAALQADAEVHVLVAGHNAGAAAKQAAAVEGVAKVELTWPPLAEATQGLLALVQGRHLPAVGEQRLRKRGPNATASHDQRLHASTIRSSSSSTPSG